MIPRSPARQPRHEPSAPTRADPEHDAGTPADRASARRTISFRQSSNPTSLNLRARRTGATSPCPSKRVNSKYHHHRDGQRRPRPPSRGTNFIPGPSTDSARHRHNSPLVPTLLRTARLGEAWPARPGIANDAPGKPPRPFTGRRPYFSRTHPGSHHLVIPLRDPPATDCDQTTSPWSPGPRPGSPGSGPTRGDRCARPSTMASPR
jgi:hypothetical protein